MITLTFNPVGAWIVFLLVNLLWAIEDFRKKRFWWASLFFAGALVDAGFIIATWLGYVQWSLG